MTRRIAVIPARGGSKRLPNKNVLDFHGKPIIAYTIRAALTSKVFDRVVVSTEDSEIANVAQEYGARVSKRPEHLATDQATVNDVCLDLLAREEREGRRYHVIGCLYATAPLRNAEDMKATVELIEPGKCDFAMAVTHYSHPPFQAMRVNREGFLEELWPDLAHRKTQEMEEVFIDNGSTYAASVPAFMERRTFRGPRAKAFLMPRVRSVDIDVREDFELALYFAEKLGL